MSEQYSIYYQHWTRFLLLGLFPILVLIFVNWMIWRQVCLRKTKKINERSFFVINILIVLLFLVCHIPRLALNFYESVDAENIKACGPPIWSEICLVISRFLHIINSAGNFFIYFLTNSRFRRDLIKCGSSKEESVFSKETIVANNKGEEIKEVTEMQDLEESKLLTT